MVSEQSRTVPVNVEMKRNIFSPTFSLTCLCFLIYFFASDGPVQPDRVRKKCWSLINGGGGAMTTAYKLRNPGLVVYSTSSSSLSTSPPLWAAEFFLLTCLLEVPRGLCMGTRRRNPGWPLEAVPEDVVIVLNVQGINGEEAEHEDEGLTLWMEE